MRQDYLEVRDLRVSFGGFVAVAGVDLTLIQGECHFLIGPNGAGKTTLIDALTGLVPATGSASLGIDQLLGLAPHQIARMGVGRTFQTAAVFDDLSVIQNLDIAARGQRRWFDLLLPRSGVSAEVGQALSDTGLEDVADQPAGSLSHGQRQWLEIGMLLAQQCRVLLLDEPVAGLDDADREETGRLLGQLAEERVMIVVEHDMDFVREFADQVTVLHQGLVLATGTVSQIQSDPQVQAVYLGTAPGSEHNVPPSLTGHLG